MGRDSGCTKLHFGGEAPAWGVLRLGFFDLPANLPFLPDCPPSRPYDA